MNIGVKLFGDDRSFFDKFKDHVDFFEVMAFPRCHYDFLRDCDLPFVVHNSMFAQGVNLANPERNELNVASLKHSIDVADRINAKYIIVHPEVEEHVKCDIENTADLIKEFNDKRIIVENMSLMYKQYLHYLNRPEQMKDFKKSSKINFCLDFAHASESASALNQEVIPFVNKFISLNPVHFHLSDADLNSLSDLHLHLRHGNLMLNEFKKMIASKAFVTLEVDHVPGKVLQDIKFLRL
jgi:endonuclease IV